MQTILDLTDRFPLRFDVERMKDDLRRLEDGEWLAHYDKQISNGWTAIPLVSQDGSLAGPDAQRLGTCGRYKRTPVVDRLPYFRAILDAFDCPQGRVRISRLLPHSIIRPHRDICGEAASVVFDQVRLHIPIITNHQVVFIVGRQSLRLRPGRLYYIDFTKRHWVLNDGNEPRVHLILDLTLNDFLRELFPPLTRTEQLQKAVLRWTLPVVWPLFRVTFALSQHLMPAQSLNPRGAEAARPLDTAEGVNSGEIRQDHSSSAIES